MPKAVSTVSPTRMELIRLRQRVSLAQKGHDLLEEKMEALMMEFLGLVRRIKAKRREAFSELAEAHRKLGRCMAVMGRERLLQAARSTLKRVQLESSTRSVMGVRLPLVEPPKTERRAVERGYQLHTTSALLDEASLAFERALRSLCELAELEESVRWIGYELERTRRRVNALEHVLIPRLRSLISFISFRLEEMERDNFVRLKRVKVILEERRWR